MCTYIRDPIVFTSDHTDRNTYVRLSVYIKYILYIEFKFGILNLKIFMIIMILCKHYGIP